MGVFERRVRVSGPLRETWREIDAVIDTGSDNCQFPPGLLEAVNAEPISREIVLLPNAREVEAQVVGITLQIDGYMLPTTAYVGPAGGPALIGSIVLSQLGLGVDARGERLILRVGHLLSETRWPTV